MIPELLIKNYEIIFGNMCFSVYLSSHRFVPEVPNKWLMISEFSVVWQLALTAQNKHV